MDNTLYTILIDNFWCLHHNCLTSVELFKTQQELDNHHTDCHIDDNVDSNNDDSDNDDSDNDDSDNDDSDNDDSDNTCILTKKQIVTQSVSVALHKVYNINCNDNIQLAKIALNEYYKNVKVLSEEDKLFVT